MCSVRESTWTTERWRGSICGWERERKNHLHNSVIDWCRKIHKIQGKRWDDKKRDLMQAVLLDFAWTCVISRRVEWLSAACFMTWWDQRRQYKLFRCDCISRMSMRGEAAWATKRPSPRPGARRGKTGVCQHPIISGNLKKDLKKKKKYRSSQGPYEYCW